MRDMARQVGPEQDIHRAANTHFTFEGQIGVLSNQRVSAIGTEQILRAHHELLASQPIEQRRGHALLVLNVAFVFRRHARLSPARTCGLEQQRLHEGLRQVVHLGRRRQ